MLYLGGITPKQQWGKRQRRMGSNAWWCVTVLTTANDKPWRVPASLLTGAATWPYRTSSYRQYGVTVLWNNLRKGGTLRALFPVGQMLSPRKLTFPHCPAVLSIFLDSHSESQVPCHRVQKWWEETVGMWLVASDSQTTRNLIKSLMVAAETVKCRGSQRCWGPENLRRYTHWAWWRVIVATAKVGPVLYPAPPTVSVLKFLLSEWVHAEVASSTDLLSWKLENHHWSFFFLNSYMLKWGQKSFWL